MSRGHAGSRPAGASRLLAEFGQAGYPASSKLSTMSKSQSKQLVVCVENFGYLASLEKRKIYLSLRDPVAEKHGLVRIVDESGDDYLHPKEFFRAIELPQSVRRAVLAAG